MAKMFYFHCSEPKTVGLLNINIPQLFEEYKTNLAKKGLVATSVPHMDIQTTGYEGKDAEVTIRCSVKVVEEEEKETANV